MRLNQFISIALINTFGVSIGMIIIPKAQSVTDQQNLASPLATNQVNHHQLSQNLIDRYHNAKSLTELENLRDRLIEISEKIAQASPAYTQLFKNDELSQIQAQNYEKIKQLQTTIEQRIQVENEAMKTWENAQKLATQAVAIGKAANAWESWEEARQYWQASLNTLRKIPANSLLTERAIEKTIEYQSYLAIATYNQQMIKVVATNPESTNQKPQVKSIISSISPLGFQFYGDTNRDGIINAADETGKNYWSWSQGALMLFNNNDDDRDHQPDAEDDKVNGQADAKDLAIVKLELSRKYRGSEIYISTDIADQPYINIFQKTNNGWRLIDPSGKQPLKFRRRLILGIEAKQFANANWSGVVTVKATAQRQGEEIASDTMQIGVVPWILSGNDTPVSELYVSDRGQANQKFIDQITKIVEPIGVKVKVISGGNISLKDAAKIGYVQFPNADKKSGLETTNVALTNNLSKAKDRQPKSLLKEDLGWFNIGKISNADPLNRTLNNYSNFGVTPPVSGYPLGRIYYGNAGNITPDRDLLKFLQAQQIQGDPIGIDTSWLLVRHVDEIINFIPSKSGQPLVLVASPLAGVKLLEDLADRGQQKAKINRDLSNQTTVEATLNNQALIEHNLRLQRDRINPIITKLQQELGLTDNQIIQVPMLFGYSGYAWWPNLVNSVVVNGQLLVSDPRGAIVDGQDATQIALQKLLEPASVKVHFIDDRYYQELRENVGGAVNTTRAITDQQFWQLLPDKLLN